MYTKYVQYYVIINTKYVILFKLHLITYDLHTHKKWKILQVGKYEKKLKIVLKNQRFLIIWI